MYYLFWRFKCCNISTNSTTSIILFTFCLFINKFQAVKIVIIKLYILGRYYVQGVFIKMLSNADNILPVSMRWIYNFLYYWPVTVAIRSGDMNKNLKLEATLQ